MNTKAKNIILVIAAMLTISTGFSAGKDKDKDKDKPCPGATYADKAKRTSLKEVFSNLGDKIKDIKIGGKEEGPVTFTGISKKEAKAHTEKTKEATLNMIHSYEENETFMGYATDDSVPAVATK